jgi:hypothetical protein
MSRIPEPKELIDCREFFSRFSSRYGNGKPIAEIAYEQWQSELSGRPLVEQLQPTFDLEMMAGGPE